MAAEPDRHLPAAACCAAPGSPFESGSGAVRAPQDAEILVALVAGQIEASTWEPDDSPTVEQIVDRAEKIIGEVIRRGDERTASD